MASPNVLQEDWKGFWQDLGKEHVPKGYLWDCLDWLPRVGASLRRRGGWTYQGVDLSTLNAAATVPHKVMWAPFVSTAGQVLAFDNNGRLFDLTNGADRGAATVPLHTPSFFRDLVLWADGSNPAKSYDGAAIANLAGAPPSTPRCSTVWKERLLLSGRSSITAEHASLYFSAPGNPNSWDTTNATVRTNGPIQGMAGLRSQLVVFHPSSVERIRGNTPPSATGVGDLVLEPLFDNVGIFEPNSFVASDDAVIWADAKGLYSTDGASLTDLTEKGGIKQYWATLFDSNTITNVAVGASRGYAFVSLQTSTAYVDFLVCHIESRSWFRFSSLRAHNFSAKPGTDHVYFSNRTTKFVGNLGPTLIPKASVKADPAGIADMAPTFTSGWFPFSGQGKKRVRNAYLSYYQVDAATDNPVLTLAYALTPETDSYTNLAPTLAETTAKDRVRIPVDRQTAGISFKLTQTGPSSDTRIFALEVDTLPQEGSKL